MMIDLNIEVILFVVACLILINGVVMTMDFLERARKRQQKRRSQATGEPIPPPLRRIPRIKTAKGYLLNENGETDHYISECRDFTQGFSNSEKHERIIAATKKMDAQPPPWIFSQAMLDYYADVPTLEPIEH